MSLRVGLTGGIGSGKSTVAKVFEVLGIPVYYADEAAKHLMNEDPLLKEQLIQHFGTATYTDGALNRKYLSGIVFNDPAKLELLNSLVHPATIRDGEQWMKQQYLTLLPSSPLRDAIAYALRHWKGLSHYTTDGMLNIDNNPVENSIRPVALGRKNFLFAGSQRGAERIAIIYSLIGTCKMNNVNPYEWLKDVLERLNDYPVNKIADLLPHNWKIKC